MGEHARVLAVAGSGKSTTMAHRIRHLVQERQIRPSAIQALMFNSLARKQFQARLSNVGLPEVCQPAVHTFHSFSFHILNQLVKNGALPSSTQFWLADKAELVWLAVKRAINNLEKARHLPPDAVDPEEALSAIGRWKGSLIPPDRAGITVIGIYLGDDADLVVKLKRLFPHLTISSNNDLPDKLGNLLRSLI